MSLFQSWAALRAQHGKTFVCGKVTPASEDVTQATGLSTVDYCGGSLFGIPAATHTFSIFQPASTAGSINILSYEEDYTVSTTEVAVTWWAVGDA